MSKRVMEGVRLVLAAGQGAHMAGGSHVSTGARKRKLAHSVAGALGLCHLKHQGGVLVCKHPGQACAGEHVQLELSECEQLQSPHGEALKQLKRAERK